MVNVPQARLMDGHKGRGRRKWEWMMARKHTGTAVAVAALLAFGTGAASAAQFSADYVFGDSLSDRGNLAAALGHNFPSPPFFHDSFTNGPTAV